MSSGACRALVSLLLTLVATIVMALPVAANTDRLEESSTITYTVVPADGAIDVSMTFRLRTGQAPFPSQAWGPIIVEQRERPSVITGWELITPAQEAPALWKSWEVLTPDIDGGRASKRLVASYRIDASPLQEGSILDETPARVDSSYFYFCALGQDTDSGSVKIEIDDDAAWTLTQSGTPLKKSRTNGLESGLTQVPAEVFTCVEGVREDKLAPGSFIGPAGRQVVLQAWASRSNWLQAAETRAQPALDAIHAFLEHDIPGEGPVIIRMAPPRELGGYASAHDTPGIVQLDEDAGVTGSAPEHQLAHAWFTTDTFIELWMREGMALWTASAMNGEACAPAGPNATGLELSAWQVVRPTSGGGWEEDLAEQDAAACGIVSAVAARMSPEQWREVIGSLLDGETKYVGLSGPDAASSPTVDYREWLDAVDERGLVPAAADPAFAGNLDDLDFAQDLLDDYGIAASGPELAERSAARAYYHQFLADAAPLGAPLAVRKAMDDWSFGEATEALDKSYEVLDALTEADRLLPTAGLVPLIQRTFEAAASVEEIEDVRVEALYFLENATELVDPMGSLQSVTPPGWDDPAAIATAIEERRFDDVLAAITPARTIAQEISAADAALPEAGLLDRFAPLYSSSATQGELEDLAGDAAAVRREAEATGTALGLLRTEVGEWQIPAAVTDPIDSGQITAGRAIVGDARSVVAAARLADIALPEAQLSTDIRPRFEGVTTAAQMSALRAEAEARSAEAQKVGGALKLLGSRVPEWRIPAVVTDPVAARDFATAALTADAAQRWIENAWQADQDWAEFGALERVRDGFENAQSLEELEAGAELAADWSQAADWIGRAELAVNGDRDLLTEFGLWGVDVNAPLGQAKEAGLRGDVDLAINKSTEVVSLIGNGSSSGGLRLAGIVFFGVAVLGVLGLWVILRRQTGPPWARQSKPHWMTDDDSRKKLSAPKKTSAPKKDEGRKRISGPRR